MSVPHTQSALFTRLSCIIEKNTPREEKAAKPIRTPILVLLEIAYPSSIGRAKKARNMTSKT